MPLETKYYEFDAEIERLEGRIDDIAEKVADLDPTSKRAKTLESQGNNLDTYRRGLEWARDQWDVDGVELGGLTAGEYGRMQDEIPDGAGDGATRTIYVAHGTVDAPYVGDDTDETTANVANLALAYVRWAEAQINDLTSVGESGNRFYASLSEKRARKTSGETSG